jgi:glycosyltransferase involved in cell wall biosynthesis
MRIHIYGSNGVPTIPRLTVCAFNQTAIKYAKSLKEQGHHIIFYGTKEFESQFETICSEFVPNSSIETFKPLVSMQKCQEHFDWDDNVLKEWQTEFGATMWHPNLDSLSPEELENHLITAFSFGSYLSNSMGPACMNIVRCVRQEVRSGMEIASDYIQPGDIILTFYDVNAYDLYRKWEQQGAIVVYGLEQSGGYSLHNRIIFASQHTLRTQNRNIDGIGKHHYVVPPFFQPADFTFNPRPRDPTGPFLFLGRIQECKGAVFFLDLVRRFPKFTFWMAGPAKFENNKLYVQNYGYDMLYDLDKYPNLKFWGIADKQLRSKLLSEATALIQPSQYGEPFGWNVVEANLCGTPAIAPHRGAFPETIEIGVSGFRYPVAKRQHYTAEEWNKRYDTEIEWSHSKWMSILQACASLSPDVIRERAIRLYSEESIMTKYVEALEKIKADPGDLLITF